MGLFSRLPRGGASAVHARIADGEHLWLAVRGAGSLTLVRAGGGPDLDVPTEVETHDGETLLTALLPLAASYADDPARDLVLRLCHGDRRRPVAAAWPTRPDSPTVETPATGDRRWQWSVGDVEGRVVLHRVALAPSVAVLGITATEAGVAVRLDGGPTKVTADGVPLPVVDGVVVLGDVADLPLETNVLLEADGLPVVRARSVPERPHYATLLPPVPSPGVELRWLRDGRLALYRREEPVA